MANSLLSFRVMGKIMGKGKKKFGSLLKGSEKIAGCVRGLSPGEGAGVVM